MDPELQRMQDIVDPFADELSTPAPLVPLPAQASSPTRNQIERRRWLAFAAALLYGGLVVVMMGLRGDLATIPPVALLAAALLPLLAAVVALLVATRTRPPRIGQASSTVAASPLLPLFLFVLSSMAPAGSTAPSSFWASLGMCVVGTAIFAAGPLLLAVLAFRRGFVAAAPWRTAALGVACGALAAAIELRCSVAGVPHVLFGHGAALIGGGLAGYVLSRFTRT